ncbi:hypothetical protein LWI28_001074 [Acer negundo]|uniref:3'-5' exonuclease domain-containing protein n=1 Tax=Acer negundo TaxID=4023 RepID=A0AAD5IBH0_ACENE|nr:hypothetical protein LWI28_001074 [Acer negundo]
MTVTIFDHKLSSSTHNIYDVNFFGDRIRTMVTNCPSIVESWISEIKLIHQQRLDRLIVGLDIEHHPNFNYKNEHPVATLQLCVGHRCLIFQMIHAPDIPQCLEDFLLNDKYSFVGVKVDEDAEKLKNDYNLSVGNAIDLRTLAAEHVEVLGMNMKELKQAGLKGLSERILGKKLEKPKQIQLSKWDDRKLSSDQVQYACLDAFVSFEIARTLKKNPSSLISSSQPRGFIQKTLSTFIMIAEVAKTINDISDHLTLHRANYQSRGSMAIPLNAASSFMDFLPGTNFMAKMSNQMDLTMKKTIGLGRQSNGLYYLTASWNPHLSNHVRHTSNLWHQHLQPLASTTWTSFHLATPTII